jgi:hypothetical protein
MLLLMAPPRRPARAETPTDPENAAPAAPAEPAPARAESKGGEVVDAFMRELGMPERLPRAEWGAGDGGDGQSPPAGKGARRRPPAVGRSLFAAGTDSFIRKRDAPVAPPAPAPADGVGVGAGRGARGADLDSSLESNKTDASRGTAASSVPAPAPVPAPVPTFAPPAVSRWKLRTQPFLLLLRRIPVLCLVSWLSETPREA